MSVLKFATKVFHEMVLPRYTATREWLLHQGQYWPLSLKSKALSNLIGISKCALIWVSLMDKQSYKIVYLRIFSSTPWLTFLRSHCFLKHLMYEQYSHCDNPILLQFALFQNAPFLFSIPWLVVGRSFACYFHICFLF